jgi:hypothetical protein
MDKRQELGSTFNDLMAALAQLDRIRGGQEISSDSTQQHLVRAAARHTRDIVDLVRGILEEWS